MSSTGEKHADRAVSKEMIRNRLVWILEAFPRINPSRAVLVRVNEFLMSNRTSTM